MLAWIRFFIVAAIMLFALSLFVSELLGFYRFGFVMNRVHAAGIGDTLGLFSVILALMIAEGISMVTLKLLLLVLFMWFSSPTSTHFVSQIEYFTNPSLYSHVRREGISEEELSPRDTENKEGGESAPL